MPVRSLPPDECSALGRWVSDWLERQEQNLNSLANRVGKQPTIFKYALKKGIIPEKRTIAALSQAMGVPKSILWRLVLQEVIEECEREETEVEIVQAPAQPRPPRRGGISGQRRSALAAEHVRKAQALMTLREYQRAVDELIKAVELTNQDTQKVSPEAVSENLLDLALCRHGMAGQGVEYLSEADTYYQQTLVIAEEHGLTEYAARVLIGQGHTALHRGALEQANDFYIRAEQMLEVYVERFPGMMRSIFEGQGLIAYTLEDWPKATALYHKADIIDSQIHDKKALYLNMGYALTRSGQHDEAEETLIKVLDYAISFKDKNIEAMALFRLGYNEELRDMLSRAFEYYNRASEIDNKAPEAILGLLRIQKAMGGSSMDNLLARHGYQLLCSTASSPVYDLKEEWITCLEFLGKSALQGVNIWITRQIKCFPANATYWSTPKRQEFLSLLNHLAEEAKYPYSAD
ncbi:tetratricopeptide repeat protein [Anthocerotibacter panamensis]|uniref:tetratricopeptide repeat protein n=1 Tax=Anthocerotibacter panamensis TaxID=2857077 RepID=UPI001C404775|nr:tetratricopeptide repeat protein [Anthocerotibacter panamensis]